jgi:hypothetical protein
MIGEIIQHILDKGFLLNYRYDDMPMERECHIFRIKKYCGQETVQAQWMIDKEETCKDILLLVADRYMRKIDDAIAQRRLLEQALQVVNNASEQ